MPILFLCSEKETCRSKSRSFFLMSTSRLISVSPAFAACPCVCFSQDTDPRFSEVYHLFRPFIFFPATKFIRKITAKAISRTTTTQTPAVR